MTYKAITKDNETYTRSWKKWSINNTRYLLLEELKIPTFLRRNQSTDLSIKASSPTPYFHHWWYESKPFLYLRITISLNNDVRARRLPSSMCSLLFVAIYFWPHKKIKKKHKKKIQIIRGYIRRNPRRLFKLVAKDQNDKWKCWRTKNV